MPIQKSSVRKKIAVEPMVTTAATQDSSSMTDMLPEFGTNVVPRKKAKAGKAMKSAVIVIVLIVIAGAAGYFSDTARMKNFLWPEKKFSAVFLTNGQVYFGQIDHEDSQNVMLSNVWYMQQTAAADPSGQPQVQLVKKGDEPYQPESTIRVNRSQVIVVETLKPDSQILKEIQAKLQAK